MDMFYSNDRNEFEKWAYDYDPYEDDWRAEDDRAYEQWDNWQNQQSCW